MQTILFCYWLAVGIIYVVIAIWTVAAMPLSLYHSWRYAKYRNEHRLARERI